MQVPARLRWTVEQGRFAAYPIGSDRRDRLAIVQHQAHRPTGLQWFWAVRWPGWFADDGVAADKQEAADRATEAWWRLIVTPQPRDVDAELDVIVARILVMPLPNSLLMESTDYLQRLNQMLARNYAAEMKAETTPPAVRNVLASLSAELYRRRISNSGAI